MIRQNAVWGNENPSKSFDEHSEDCTCINCEVNRTQEVCHFCDEEYNEDQLSVVGHNGEDVYICDDCAEKMGEYYGDRIVPEAN